MMRKLFERNRITMTIAGERSKDEIMKEDKFNIISIREKRNSPLFDKLVVVQDKFSFPLL